MIAQQFQGAFQGSFLDGEWRRLDGGDSLAGDSVAEARQCRASQSSGAVYSPEDFVVHDDGTVLGRQNVGPPPGTQPNLHGAPRALCRQLDGGFFLRDLTVFQDGDGYLGVALRTQQPDVFRTDQSALRQEFLAGRLKDGTAQELPGGVAHINNLGLHLDHPRARA